MRTVPYLAIFLAAAAPAVAGEGPRLHVENKELDFGVIMHGSKTTKTLALENRGDEPLLLKRVKPSCGCTVADYPKSIAPGKTGQLTLTFDSTERPAGYQSFRVAIYSNDETQKDLGGFCTLVSLRGEVRTLYRVAPHGAYFGEVVRGSGQQEKRIVVTGKAQAEGGFTAKLETELPSYLQVDTEPLPANVKRKGVSIVVRLLPGAPLGQIDTDLRFRTNVAEQPVFRIAVAALVNQRITAPPGVHFGPVARATGASRTVPIERRDGKAGIPVAAVRYDEQRLKVTSDTVSEQKVELAVELLPGAPPGPFASSIDVFLDDPEQSLVRIPVYGRIEPTVRVEPPTALVPPKGEELQVLVVGGKVGGATIVGPKGTIAKQDVTLQPQDGGGTLVRVTCELTPQAEEAVLVLTTDVEGEERIEVPLHRR